MPPKAQGRGHFYNKWPPVNRRSSKVSRGVAFMAHPLHPLQHVGQHHHEQVRHVGRGAVQEPADRAVDGEGPTDPGEQPESATTDRKMASLFSEFLSGGSSCRDRAQLAKTTSHSRDASQRRRQRG